MSDILSEIYHDSYCPAIRAYKPGPSYKQVLEQKQQLEKELLDALSPELKAKFLKYSDTDLRLSALSCEMEFREGFRLGAQLMLAALGTDSDQDA